MKNARNSIKGLATLALASSIGLGGCGAVVLGAGAAVGYTATKKILGPSNQNQSAQQNSIGLDNWGKADSVYQGVDYVGHKGWNGTLSIYDDSGKGLQYFNERNTWAQIPWGSILEASGQEGSFLGQDRLEIRFNNRQPMDFIFNNNCDMTALVNYINNHQK